MSQQFVVVAVTANLTGCLLDNVHDIGIQEGSAATDIP